MIQDYAQQLAEYTSTICGHAVILTDEHAVIIGASDPDRLGQLNEAAMKVIEQKAPLTPFPGYIDGMENTLPGITLPIELNRQIYGTIGIQGERAEVEKYGLLLKKYSELFLRDRILLQTGQIKENALNDFLYELVSFNACEESGEHLILRGEELGFNLRLPRIAVMVDMRIDTGSGSWKPDKKEFDDFDRMFDTIQFRKIIRTIFSHPEDFVAPGKNRKIVILHALRHPEDPTGEEQRIIERCKSLLNEMKKNGIRASIAIGSQALDIGELAESLREARDLVNVSHLEGNEDYTILNIKSFVAEKIIHDLNKSQKDWILRKVLPALQVQSDSQDLFMTIKAWCESLFNQVSAAKKLGIHRNTLMYRLDRIEHVTGYNPKEFKDVLGLYIGILLDREK